MTVAEMRDTVGNQEYLEWGIYHGRLAQRRELAMKEAQKGKKRG